MRWPEVEMFPLLNKENWDTRQWTLISLCILFLPLFRGQMGQTDIQMTWPRDADSHTLTADVCVKWPPHHHISHTGAARVLPIALSPWRLQPFSTQQRGHLWMRESESERKWVSEREREGVTEIERDHWREKGRGTREKERERVQRIEREREREDYWDLSAKDGTCVVSRNAWYRSSEWAGCPTA